MNLRRFRKWRKKFEYQSYADIIANISPNRMPMLEALARDAEWQEYYKNNIEKHPQYDLIAKRNKKEE